MRAPTSLSSSEGGDRRFFVGGFDLARGSRRFGVAGDFDIGAAIFQISKTVWPVGRLYLWLITLCRHSSTCKLLICIDLPMFREPHCAPMRRYAHVSFSYQQARNARQQTNKKRPSRRQIIRILLSENSDPR